MTARDSLPLQINASLFHSYRSSVVWFWVILFLIYAGVGIFHHVTLRSVLGTESDVWGGIASQASRWFVLVIGILVATLSLPVHVAHGLTRRDFAAGAALFGLLLALLCSGAVVAGYVIFSGVHWAGTRPEQPLLWVAVSLIFLLQAWFLAGSLIGAGFYRFRKWGMLFIPAGLACVAGVEAASRESSLFRSPGRRSCRQRSPWPCNWGSSLWLQPPTTWWYAIWV